MVLITYILTVILLFPSLYILGFPIWVDLILWIALIFILRSRVQILIICFLIITISFLINTFDLTTSATQESDIYYRPHHKYAAHNSYEKNVDSMMIQKFGDLYKIDDAKISKKELVKQPRKMRFITDNYGFRNNKYTLEESEIILVGDSLIIGHGNTQEDIPANQLSEISSLKVASIAYVGDPDHYEIFVKDHFNILNKNSKIILFYFEGNDFYENKDIHIPLNILLRKKYLHMEVNKDRILFRKIYSKKNTFTRKIRTITHSINRKLIYVDQLSKVEYHKVGNKYMAFHKNYSNRQNETYIFKNSEILNKIIAVFLIPPKSKTYAKFINKNFSNERFLFLKDKYNAFDIPVIDLTELLTKKADDLLRDDKYIYWRDDTHWNSLGIKISMECVNNFIKSKYKNILNNNLIMNFKC